MLTFPSTTDSKVALNYDVSQWAVTKADWKLYTEDSGLFQTFIFLHLEDIYNI